jgi:hypothetical protein
MPAQIFILDKVPESKLIDIIKEAGDDDADIVTAVNDNQGTFTIESTFLQPAAAGAAGAAGATITLDGKMSTFGGPGDTGVGPAEGLSLFERADVPANPDLFLPTQPPGTTGLARLLNPDAKYLACRWNLSVTPKSFLKLKTTLVTVSNPANGKSANARPADTGPAIETGRVADLSPGLATALGLKTNDTCDVLIPTPGGAQLPPPGTGVAVGVNLAAIDATIFAPGMTRTLVVVTTSNNTTYWVINRVGPNEGGQSLLRHAGDKTDVLLNDTTVFPVKASDKIPAAVADELNKAAPELAPAAEQGGTAPQPGDDINAKMFTSAKGFVGHDTSNVPGTKGGSLACAWAVNQVTRLALGKPISADEQGRNDLSTIEVFQALKAHHTKLNSANDAKPGTIIIAPSTDLVHGHVGIVGATAGGVRDTEVFSNKSHPGVFARNFNIGSFTDHYAGMGLQVLFFALNRDQF